MIYTGNCAECDKEFCWYRNRQRKFCSKRCGDIFNGRAKRRWVDVTCANCGKAFQKKQPEYLKTQKHFCNHACMGQWQSANWLGKNNPTYNSVDCTCAICGKAYIRTPSAIANGEGNFCSNKCKGVWISQNRSGANSPYWQGGKEDYRGPNWEEQRDKARERDKYRCCRCKAHESKLDRALDVHHIIPFRTFGADRYEEANQLTNLISYCRSCHITVEKGHIPVQLGLI